MLCARLAENTGRKTSCQKS